MSIFTHIKTNKVDSSEYIRTLNKSEDEVTKPAAPVTPEATETK
jgi:hypothetical protein